jgi:hypothetical protein
MHVKSKTIWVEYIDVQDVKLICSRIGAHSHYKMTPHYSLFTFLIISSRKKGNYMFIWNVAHYLPVTYFVFCFPLFLSLVIMLVDFVL